MKFNFKKFQKICGTKLLRGDIQYFVTSEDFDENGNSFYPLVGVRRNKKFSWIRSDFRLDT